MANAESLSAFSLWPLCAALTSQASNHLRKKFKNQKKGDHWTFEKQLTCISFVRRDMGMVVGWFQEAGCESLGGKMEVLSLTITCRVMVGLQASGVSHGHLMVIDGVMGRHRQVMALSCGRWIRILVQYSDFFDGGEKD